MALLAIKKNELYSVYTEYKLKLWGIIFPLIATLLFNSVVAGISVVAFACFMLLKNHKTAEAVEVVKYYVFVVLTAIFILSIGAFMAAF